VRKFRFFEILWYSKKQESFILNMGLAIFIFSVTCGMIYLLQISNGLIKNENNSV